MCLTGCCQFGWDSPVWQKVAERDNAARFDISLWKCVSRLFIFVD